MVKLGMDPVQDQSRIAHAIALWRRGEVDDVKSLSCATSSAEVMVFLADDADRPDSAEQCLGWKHRACGGIDRTKQNLP